MDVNFLLSSAALAWDGDVQNINCIGWRFLSV